MNKARFLWAVTLPLVGFYLAALALGAVASAIFQLSDSIPHITVWLCGIVFWICSGLIMGALQSVIANPRLNEATRAKAETWAKLFFYGLNIFYIFLVCFGYNEWVALIAISPLAIVVGGIAIWIYCGCFAWGKLEMEHFLEYGGAQFFVGISSPWEKEADDPRNKQQP